MHTSYSVNPLHFCLVLSKRAGAVADKAEQKKAKYAELAATHTLYQWPLRL